MNQRVDRRRIPSVHPLSTCQPRILHPLAQPRMSYVLSTRPSSSRRQSSPPTLAAERLLHLSRSAGRPPKFRWSRAGTNCPVKPHCLPGERHPCPFLMIFRISARRRCRVSPRPRARRFLAARGLRNLCSVSRRRQAQRQPQRTLRRRVHGNAPTPIGPICRGIATRFRPRQVGLVRWALPRSSCRSCRGLRVR